MPMNLPVDEKPVIIFGVEFNLHGPNLVFMDKNDFYYYRGFFTICRVVRPHARESSDFCGIR